MEIIKFNQNIDMDIEIIKMFDELKTKFPLAWKTIFKKFLESKDIDIEEFIPKGKSTISFDFESFIIGHQIKFSEVLDIIINELKNNGIDAYIGRTIQEKTTLYKPMIVDIRENDTTIIYFLIDDKNNILWQKLSYEEMSEFGKIKHFSGYDSVLIANNTLISKAFGILNTKLYG